MTVLVDRTSDWGSSQSFKRWESKPGIGRKVGALDAPDGVIMEWLDERALWY